MLFDERLLVAAMEHSRRASAARGLRVIIKVLCASGLLALVIFVLVAAVDTPKVLLVGLIPVLFLALLAVGPRIDYWLAKRRLRSSPIYGDELLISVDERGISHTSPKIKPELAWSTVVGAERFPDGFLLSLGHGVRYWWPDHALVAGNIGQVEQLLKSHARTYRSHVA